MMALTYVISRVVSRFAVRQRTAPSFVVHFPPKDIHWTIPRERKIKPRYTKRLSGPLKSSSRALSAPSSHDITSLRTLPPTMTFDMHKGECGRVGVVGGCREYTGAPYFAAISALKVGGDLSHVFCAQGAASVIKSYSPELIVHPILDAPNAAPEIAEWLPRLHVLVIGPGLGRDRAIMTNVKQVVAKARELSIPLVIDADGVFLVSQDPAIVTGYSQTILTPNAVEYTRLYQAVTGRTPDHSVDIATSVTALSKAMGDVTIVRKGQHDVIGRGSSVLVCSGAGSPRRCGGQGDLLSGSMATFLHWANMVPKGTSPLVDSHGPTMAAAFAACTLTRECNRRSFEQKGRSMTTTDMVANIHDAFTALFEENGVQGGETWGLE